MAPVGLRVALLASTMASVELPTVSSECVGASGKVTDGIYGTKSRPGNFADGIVGLNNGVGRVTDGIHCLRW